MGLNSISQITRDLMLNGMDPEMPASILCKGFSSGEKRIDGALGTIVDKAYEAQTPAILVIGHVAGMQLNRECAGLYKFQRNKSLF